MRPEQQFVDLLYGDADSGWLTLFFTPSKKTVWFPIGKPIPSIDKKENCYLGLGVRRKKTTGRGLLEDVVGIPGLWLDLDYQSGEAHKATAALPPDESSTLALIENSPQKPTLIVHSGHGIQVYWLFNEVWYFDDDKDRRKAAQLCRGWQQFFQAKGKEKGWHVDSTADLTRVFRIPGSMNVKTKPWKPVRIHTSDTVRYEPSDFDDFMSTDTISSTSAIPEKIVPHSIDILPIGNLPDRAKYLILHGDSLRRYPSRSEAVFAAIHALIGAGREDDEIAGILLDERYALSEMPREKGHRWLGYEIARAHQKALQAETKKASTSGLPKPETLTELLAANIPAPYEIVPEFLHEGMLLFGGKSKRGKSWLMMDLALSVAVGRAAFRHFPILDPAPVLFLALEDGRKRIQGRARKIQENLVRADNFHLLYEFPKLAEGGVERLASYIKKYGYKMIVIDVLAKIESTAKKRDNGEQGYHQIYDMFTPLQQLRNQYPFCLGMLTHLRKQDAEDVFDSLHGSVAYQGAQDVLWVLERKPRDSMAFLHIRDKDAEDRTLAMQFIEGHWEYVGEGEEYTLDKERRAVLRILSEERREMTISEIMKGCGIPEMAYERFRKMLQRLVKDDIIHRTKGGRYSGTIRVSEEVVDDGMPY